MVKIHCGINNMKAPRYRVKGTQKYSKRAWHGKVGRKMTSRGIRFLSASTWRGIFK